MKTKSPGISIMISVIASLFVSMLVLGTMTSIGRSFDQSSNLERSLHFFYASESGIESALFHKNAGGIHAHFPATTADDQNYQTMAFPDSDQKALWSVDARDNALWGLIQENKPLQFDLFHPSDRSIVTAPSSSLTSWPETENFTLTLYENSEDIPDVLKTPFVKKFGNVDITGYPFIRAESQDAPLIDWFAKRLHATRGYETFRPAKEPSNNICSNPDTIGFRLCKSHFESPTATQHELSTADTGTGQVSTLNTGESQNGVGFSSFLDFRDDDYSRFSLTLNPIAPFIKDPSAAASISPKAPGIPYTLTLNDAGNTSELFPRPNFVIKTEVREGTQFAFEKTIIIPETTGNNYFNYAIFD